MAENHRPKEEPAPLPNGFWPSFFRFFGALLWGLRPEDARARKRATVGGIALALLGIVGGVIARGELRTDATLAAYREDTKASIKATQDLAFAVKDLASEYELTRTELLSKIPDYARPKPQAYRPKIMAPEPARLPQPLTTPVSPATRVK